MKNNRQTPKAKKKSKIITAHSDARNDHYYWLNDATNPEVIDYLKKENRYCDQMMSHTKAFQTTLFDEMKSRIKEDDESVPYKFNSYWYIVKYDVGKDYPIYIRRKESLNAVDEVLFDCNDMAKGHAYFRLSGINISPDNTKVAFGIDTLGRRQYTIYIKDLQTSKLLSKDITNTTGSSTWANDNKTIYYTANDKKTLRSNKIYKHLLETNGKDTLVYNELDETFNTTVYKTKSQQFIVIASYSSLSNEFQILDADKPDGNFKIFQPRVKNLEYSIYHFDKKFYILTNCDLAVNFKLMITNLESTSIEHWEDLIPHREHVMIEDINIFKEFLVIVERENGLNNIRVKRWSSTEDYYLPFDNETYTAYLSTNIDFDTHILRYGYNAMTTPSSIIDFDMKLKSNKILKEQQVLGGEFKKDNYVSERIWAIAEDGTRIPMSLVHHKKTKKTKHTPLVIYAYGAYGSTIDPYFSTIRLSLLDRGFIYAIAHVRGGEYMGRRWYDDGKLLKKKNTFTDFISCSKFLIEHNYTSSQHLYAMGGSAGGLLIGGVINMAPTLYRGVIAQVPFVDVLTTMMDDSIPLTTGEYDEWGNPADVSSYNYIKSYSPYDNIAELAYPNLLITAGLHDSQVQYWEPAKWIAKLRDYSTNDNLLLLQTNMKAGHGGASGRFDSLKEDALEFAFILNLEGITK